MARVPLNVRILNYFAHSKWVSDKRRIELYPPFFLMRIKVLEISGDWSRIRVLLPLNALSQNPGGVMFGGFQAALADPIPAMACARAFPGYSIWTRAMSIDFHHGGSTDLELRFSLDEERHRAIASELENRGRATPKFEYGFYLKDGTLSTSVTNTVAIRPRGYQRATTPPVSLDEL
ncbi:MAG: DUF4442 domain-containing protein [Gammaproteobacteria bacterium]